MKIRFARHGDIPALVELGRCIHATTRFREFQFNPERIVSNLNAVLNDTRGLYCFLVAEDKSQTAVGVLIGSLERHIFSDQLVATLIHYDVMPEKRLGGTAVRLMVAFRKWAENRGVCELNAGVSSGVELEKMDRFFRKLGFRFIGGNYSLMLG